MRMGFSIVQVFVISNGFSGWTSSKLQTKFSSSVSSTSPSHLLMACRTQLLLFHRSHALWLACSTVLFNPLQVSSVEVLSPIFGTQRGTAQRGTKQVITCPDVSILISNANAVHFKWD